MKKINYSGNAGRLLLLLSLPVLFLAQSTPVNQDSMLGNESKKLADEKRFEEAVQLLEPHWRASHDSKDWVRYGTLADFMAYVKYCEGEYDSVLTLTGQTLDMLRLARLGNTTQMAKMWIWQALCYRRKDQFYRAMEGYKEAAGIYEKLSAIGDDVAYTYKNLAQVYLRYSHQKAAINYLEFAFKCDTARTLTASIYSQLASAYLFMDSLNKATYYYEEVSKLPDLNPFYKAIAQVCGAEIAFRKNEWATARRLCLSAYRYFQSDDEERDNELRTLSLLAAVEAKLGNPPAAEQYFGEAEQVASVKFTGKSREVAKLFVEKGEFLEAQGDVANALQYYQKALIQATPDFNSPDLADNPVLSDGWLESQAMRAAGNKGRALLKKSTVSTQDRENAAYCFDFALQIASKLRKTYGDDVDKFILFAANKTQYRLAVGNLWNWYRQTGDRTVLNRLFSLSERLRAQALSDALQQQRALALSGIPDSLLNEEEKLRLLIGAVRKDLTVAKLDTGTTARSLAREFENQLAQMELSYFNLSEQLKKEFPQYRTFYESEWSIAADSVPDALPPAATLLSWFDAGDRYLCLVLRKKNLSAYEVPRDSTLDNTLARFQALLADKTRQESDPAAFFTDAWLLKQRLLPDSVLAGSDQLIVVPDGRLSYLPFEALLTAPYTGSYGAAPYLLKTHAVQYAWSATLLTAPPLGAQPRQGLLQVAPFVNTARDGLATLPNSLREKPENVRATVLESNQALAGDFLRQAPEYSALHLSTHAHAGQRAEPGIEFFDRTLSLPEIYAQRLHASLVSLSACETGAGDFAEGEGVLSLARAFAYAGARSLVASHWSVNDRSTAALFAAFYQFLEQGKNKAEALRQAKLEMLAQSGPDARKAPYYWAAFTLSGADGPVVLSSGWAWWWWALAAAGIAGAGFWAYRRRYT